MAHRWTNEKTRWQWHQTQKDFAKSKGWREGENPARWKGHLSNILPPRKKLPKGHHPAMPYQDVPAFIQRLKTQQGIAASGLLFIILTCCRSGEVRQAKWEQFDWENRLWTLPASATKTNVEHEPLNSNRCGELPIRGTEFLPGTVCRRLVAPAALGLPVCPEGFEIIRDRMHVIRDGADLQPYGEGVRRNFQQGNPCYIDALGSSRAHKQRLATLKTLSMAHNALARITGPIRIIPAARDAHTLALSALAEIIDT